MNQTRVLPRCGSACHRARRALTVQRRSFRRASHARISFASAANASKGSPNRHFASVLFSVAVGAGCLYHSGYPRSLHAEAVPAAELKFEEPRKKARSREENRDAISSQHLQVKKSWESPGVYAWGNNASRVAAPDSDEVNIKLPRRIAYFDGKLLRDIKLDRTFGAAVTENGDLLQWGTGFEPTSRGPVPTLKGKDLVKISISRDRIIALSSSGTVYSVSTSKSDIESGSKSQESSWFPFWKSRSNISYRILKPNNLAWGEKVKDISSGLEHCLLLTSAGRLFSAASGTEDYPSKGQLGVPGLTWTSRPIGSYDQPHEITTLKGFEIERIATGDYHSLVIDKQGRVFSFGDNSYGQLGFEYSPESSIIDAPSLVAIDKLYRGTGQVPRVTGVAAGGTASFLTIDAIRAPGQEQQAPGAVVTADTWSFGQGIWGGLGNGRWTHAQGTPSKIKALSGLFEYDETTKLVVPIRLSHLSIGQTHASAIMNNVTHLGATNRTSENDTNWGADVLWWGGNEFYQLGTGKRNNLSNPTYIAPLDAEADREKGRRAEHRFQITPMKKIKVDGRNVSVEQRIECGRGVTAVYSGT
ncbi:regulator of chromosome condensation 1/beta-lactamase-inhibitor protein II [Bisporella sp. PMI_857]|nr:regulator of chromosome condensation 1/beta-lactamase-inhibitor protein II [Bisporella sp. PMI_857]